MCQLSAESKHRIPIYGPCLQATSLRVARYGPGVIPYSMRMLLRFPWAYYERDSVKRKERPLECHEDLVVFACPPAAAGTLLFRMGIFTPQRLPCIGKPVEDEPSDGDCNGKITIAGFERHSLRYI